MALSSIITPPSVKKKNFGPVVEWFGDKCPVPDNTPISILRRGVTWWAASNKPQGLQWNRRGDPDDIIAYYRRDYPLPDAKREPVPEPQPVEASQEDSPASLEAVEISRLRAGIYETLAQLEAKIRCAEVLLDHANGASQEAAFAILTAAQEILE